MNKEELKNIQEIIVIDCTWFQTKVKYHFYFENYFHTKTIIFYFI